MVRWPVTGSTVNSVLLLLLSLPLRVCRVGLHAPHGFVTRQIRARTDRAGRAPRSALRLLAQRAKPSAPIVIHRLIRNTPSKKLDLRHLRPLRREPYFFGASLAWSGDGAFQCMAIRASVDGNLRRVVSKQGSHKRPSPSQGSDSSTGCTARWVLRSRMGSSCTQCWLSRSNDQAGSRRPRPSVRK